MNASLRSLRGSLFGPDLKAYAALLVIAIIGFWPVATGLFSVKNDDIIYFLPYRYNIAEILRNGHFPFWSPYIYMGFPVYGDMQSGVWNPFVWLLSLTGRYTLITLHAELLLYIFLAGTGMFKLMKQLGFRRIVCFTIAVSYMFSGFITDSGQILCWVSCAAFLPYTYVYFIRLLNGPTPSASARFALANCLLFIAGGYPFFFIVNIYIMAAAFLVYLVDCAKKNELKKAITVFRYLALSAVLLTLICIAPVCSFINLLPYYARGKHLPLANALYNSYSIYSTLSLVMPFSTTRDLEKFGNNEVISRNLYIGILLLPFVIRGILQKKTLWLQTALLLTLTAFAFSLGQLLPFRKWAYWYLPLMNTFRHPANFRLFVTVGLLAVAGKGLHGFLAEATEYNRKKITGIFYILLLGAAFIAFVFLPVDIAVFRQFSLSAQGLKNILGQISFGQSVLLSLLLQAPFLAAGVLLLRKRNYRWFCYLSVLNVIIISQPQLFICTVAKDSTFAMNTFIKSQPYRFPLPDLTRAVGYADSRKMLSNNYKIPVESFFSKEVTIDSFFNNPTILENHAAFISDSALVATVSNYPVMYIADSIRVSLTGDVHQDVKKHEYWLKTKATEPAMRNPVNPLSVTKFSPDAYELAIRTDTPCAIVILQNNHPGWNAFIGNEPLPVQTVNKTFMGLKVPRGNHLICLKYRPWWFVWVMTASCLGFLLCMLIITGSRNKNRIPINT